MIEYDSFNFSCFDPDNPLITIEMTYHPITLIEKKKDQGETTVLKGMWVFPNSGDDHMHHDEMIRLPLVKIFRFVWL